MGEKSHLVTSLFHVQKKNTSRVLTEAVLRQARKTGRLNVSNSNLVTWPKEIFNLGVPHSETSDVVLDCKSGDENYKWWELEPLKFLDLSSNSLKDIPPDIRELENLTTLLLHQNMLTVLPPQLGEVKTLTKLDLAHNKLSDFPHYLSNLKELRILNLSDNNFKEFPVAIYDLVMLNNLNFSKNAIEKMEPGIGFLTSLENLNLSQNKLVSIPADINNCRALKSLNLSNNEITSQGLPELVDMRNIEIILLHYNSLTYLPRLRGCSNLKEIHLGFNKIEEITVEELSTLSHLQVINLRNNVLRKIPKELSCLQNLIRLDLSWNDLKELPPTLSLLPHLENLLVEGNSLRTIRLDVLRGGTSRLLNHLKQLLPAEEVEKHENAKFPCTAEQNFPDRYAMRCSRAVNLSSRGLCNIPNTVFEEAVMVPCNIVDISKNKLQQIPEGVWLLSKTLNDLNLSHNQLKEIPSGIAACLNLRYLNLSNNQLKSLPEELSGCPRVRELCLSCNRLEEVPSCIYELPALEILSLSDNKIVNLDGEKFLQLKCLTHLDLRNNNLSGVPPVMGKMTQLRTFTLEGNGLRAPRQATLAKGTEAVLAWLRDKIV